MNEPDDNLDIAGQYFAGAVIEQAVRDWRKAKIGHLLKDEAMESGNYFVDMQGETL